MRPETFSEVGRLIHEVNMGETFRRRVVRGQDLNEWHPVLDEWWVAEDYVEIIALLGEVVAAAESLQQFDDREPQAYWFQQLAKAHTARGDYAAAVDTLEAWFGHWPPTRQRFDNEPARMTARLVAARNRLARAAQS